MGSTTFSSVEADGGWGGTGEASTASESRRPWDARENRRSSGSVRRRVALRGSEGVGRGESRPEVSWDAPSRPSAERLPAEGVEKWVSFIQKDE